MSVKFKLYAVRERVSRVAEFAVRCSRNFTKCSFSTIHLREHTRKHTRTERERERERENCESDSRCGVCRMHDILPRRFRCQKTFRRRRQHYFYDARLLLPA